MTHQPAISFSIPSHFPFIHAGGRTSNVLQEMTVARTLPELPDPWPFDQDPNVAAVSSKHITRNGMPVLLATHYGHDHSWSFQSGQPITMADAQVVAMKTVFGFDPTIVEVADLEPGWSAEREFVGGQWIRYQEQPEHEEN